MTTKKESVQKEKTGAPKKVVKTASKKRSGNEKRQLVHASGEQCFWTNDGRIISNLGELAEVLGNMDVSVFEHHVTRDRNDFADWIESVLEDAELATSIRTSKKPSSAATFVVRRLKLYNV